MQISTEVLEEVRRLVAQILEWDIESVRPESLFFDDLGGESIELLELSFHLDKLYGVRLRFQDLASDDYKLDAEGRLTSEAIALLKAKYPFLKLDGFESRPLRRRTDFLTIEAIAAFVQTKLDSQKQQGKSATVTAGSP